jgi:hypothetical protein
VRIARLAVCLLAAVLSGCATPYGKYGIAGGYTDTRVDENTFSIHVQANGFTDQQTASMHAMYRAAEITVENGFDFFVIVSNAAGARSGTVAIPGQTYSNTNVNVYGNTAYARTTTTTAPTVYMPMTLPNSTLMIKSFKGEKPAGDPNVYDARSVMKFLGPNIGIEPKK